MAIGNTNPNPQDVVILQRDVTNSYYAETHISGSNLIIYVDSNGYVNADNSASFYNDFPPVFTGVIISSSYAITASYALNGGGGGGPTVSASWASSSLSSSQSQTASFAFNAMSASYAPSTPTVSASWASASLSASYAPFSQSYQVSSSYSQTSSFATTASFAMTSSFAQSASYSPFVPTVSASWSSQSLSASYSQTASYSNNSTSASHAVNSDSASYYGGSVVSASYAVTSSYSLNVIPTVSASWASSSLSSSQALSSSYAQTASFALVATFASQSISSSYASQSNWSVSSSYASSSLSSSYATTSSYAVSNLSSSYALSSSLSLSSSYALSSSLSLSSSYSNSSSYALNGLSSSYAPIATDFTIIQYGDPQYGYDGGAESQANMSASISWILANQVPLNIQAMVIPGDLVDVYTSNPAWVFFLSQAERIQAAGIPLIISQGNHDDSGNCVYYNASASVLISGSSAYQSTFTNGISSRGDVYAQTINGVKIAYIALSYYNVTDPLLQQWAIQTANQYSDYAVHWLIHSYLNGSGQISTATNDQYYNYGDITWQNVVSQCPNSTIVYCGHIFQTLYGDDDSPWDRSVSVGCANNVIQNLRFDTQATLWNGLQYVRVYKYKPTQNVVQATTYDTSASMWITWNDSTFNFPIRETYDNYLPPALLTETVPSNHVTGQYQWATTAFDVIQNMTVQSITYNSSVAGTASVVLNGTLDPTSSILNYIAISQSINPGLNVFNLTSSGNWFNGSIDTPLSASNQWYANTTKYVSIVWNGSAESFNANAVGSAFNGNYFNIDLSSFSGALYTIIQPSWGLIYQDGIRDATYGTAIFLNRQVYQMTSSWAQNVSGFVNDALFASSSVSSSYSLTASLANTSSYSQYSHNRYEDIDNGLVLYIPFSEGSGSVLNDYSSTGLNFTAVNASNVPTGSFLWQTSSIAGGYSVLFNGAASVSPYQPMAENLSNNTSVSGLNKLTVGCWFNTTYTGLTNEMLVSKWAVATEWFLRLNSATQVDFSTYNLSGSRIDYDVNLPYNVADGVWHYLAGTYNGTNGLTSIYLDGRLVGASTIQSGSLFYAPSVNIVIAGYADGIQYFSGSMDEVKIWNRDLSANEIQTYYQSIVNTSQPVSDVYGNEIVSGSLTALKPITGSLNGTASFAVSASRAITSSYATTSSFSLNAIPTVSASWASASISSSLSINSNTASLANTSSYSQYTHNRYEDIDNGLVLYIPFSEGTGNILYDYSSTGYNFTAVSSSNTSGSYLWNSSSCVAGGYSVDFSGSTYAQGNGNNNTNPAIAGLDRFTLSCWFNTTSSTLSAGQCLIAKDNPASPATECEWGIRFINTTVIGFIVNVNATNQSNNTTFPYNVNDGVWHHLAGTFNGNTGYCYVYLDGKKVSSYLGETGSIAPNTTPITLGCFAGGSELFSGSMDEVKIWNRDLSPNEIQSYFQSTVNTMQPASDVYGNEIISGSLTALKPITGSLNGTASFAVSASRAISSSYSNTASSLIGFPINNTSSLLLVTASNVIVNQINTGSYITAFFDYVVTSGSINLRTGTVFGGWINNTASYSEYTTVDLGNTSQITMSLFVTSSTVQLLTYASNTYSWSVRSLGRFL